MAIFWAIIGGIVGAVVGFIAAALLSGIIMGWAGVSDFESERAMTSALFFGPMDGLLIGTSIDALAVGVTLAFLDAHILVTALAIGLATFVMATIGIMVGRIIGGKFGRIAEALGGLGLILIGTKILIEHTMLV